MKSTLRTIKIIYISMQQEQDIFYVKKNQSIHSENRKVEEF